ncbi:AraC family transcriptional regulator [Alginatibacterium sediminis]|uniref:AraC family transcriptional regulator n=1 Tax=Alginatibacterium sediminis TaxID=2164068 RepID=A0A420E9G1_9ALTE|nr:helix-turn-helix transcriptional regulator [Alginatibacterium sediminis]RKF15722.1 AraC family transcriptional regulator [Alginatibacterium sediminis]
MLVSEFTPFQGQVHDHDLYQTWAPPTPISHWVHCFWQLNVPNGEYCYRSIPDNCVDLIINLDNLDDAILVSPFTAPIVYPLIGPTSYFGVRFRLLGQHILVSEPISEWSPDDHQMPAKDLLSASFIDQIQQLLSFQEPFVQRCNRFAKALVGRPGRSVVDPRVLKFVRYCYSNAGGLELKNLAPETLGLSERHLRRLTQQYLGVSPKAFSKVLRFQRALRSLQTIKDSTEWADWYFDQSHFSREFKQLSGVTPKRFLQMSVLYNNTPKQSRIILLSGNV